VLTDEFLKQKALSLGEDKVYEQENKNKYDDFKGLVLSKVIRNVDDSKDIKLTVHTTLVDFLEEYDMVGWVRANDTEANLSLLTQINELSVENKELRKAVSDLKQKMDSINFAFESDLAFEGEETTIHGTYSERRSAFGEYHYETKTVKKKTTWDKMFLLWAPRLTVSTHYISAQSELESALRDLVGRDFSINTNLFQTIKIHYSALGLIKYYEAKMVKGGTAEFIKLTNKGNEYLVRNAAIRKKEEEEK